MKSISRIMVIDLSWHIDKKQIEYYGVCTSIRVWYEGGKEVEFGLVEPSWISVPLDTGTYKVLSDGYKIVIDKKRYFEDLNLGHAYGKNST